MEEGSVPHGGRIVAAEVSSLQKSSLLTFAARGILPLMAQRTVNQGAESQVPQAIRSLRAALGLSLAEFARRWGVSRSLAYSIETGRNPNPSWQTLARLVENLGCDPRLLFPGSPPREPGSKRRMEKRP